MKVELIHPLTESERQLAAAVTPDGRIIVGVDDSPGGMAALRLALKQARSSHAQLVAVRAWAPGLPRHGGLRRRRLGPVHPHVVLQWQPTMQDQAAKDFVSRCLADAAGGKPRDVDLSVRTPEGEPGAALTGIAAANGDVIVVGQEPHLTVRRAVHGSVGHYCRGHARCPVVVVPAEEPDAAPGS